MVVFELYALRLQTGKCATANANLATVVSETRAIPWLKIKLMEFSTFFAYSESLWNPFKRSHGGPCTPSFPQPEANDSRDFEIYRHNLKNSFCNVSTFLLHCQNLQCPVRHVCNVHYSKLLSLHKNGVL